MPPKLTPKQRYHRAYWQAYKDRLPAPAPGAYLAHCQRWQKILSVPYACRYCGTEFFAGDNHPTELS